MQHPSTRPTSTTSPFEGLADETEAVKRRVQERHSRADLPAPITPWGRAVKILQKQPEHDKPEGKTDKHRITAFSTALKRYKENPCHETLIVALELMADRLDVLTARRGVMP